MCVMRTAESVTFTCCPPAPLERKVSTRRSFSFTSTSLSSDISGITSTDANDVTETLAIKHTFGDAAQDLAISSTKSMTGHLLGAAGALEALFCVRALETQTLPPTINLDHPDPECDLDHVANKAREARCEAALSTSFGFGVRYLDLMDPCPNLSHACTAHTVPI